MEKRKALRQIWERMLEKDKFQPDYDLSTQKRISQRRKLLCSCKCVKNGHITGEPLENALDSIS